MLRLLYVLIVGTFMVCLSSTNTRNAKHRTNGEEQVDVVVRLIADHLWNGSSQDARPFLVKGSYAAFAWEREYKVDLELLYNDVDVFIETNDSSKCQHANRRGFVSSKYVNGIVPDTFVQITTVCKLDAYTIVEQSDINAVNVGFLVVPKKETNQLTQNVGFHPLIDSWIWTKHFDHFIQTRTLQVVYPDNGIQNIIIRLLYKAQQMNLKYKFPADDAILEWVHGAAIAPNHMAKYNMLDEPHKSKITNRFDLVPIPRRDGWFMCVLKGKEAPKFPRILAGSAYDGYGYDVAAIDENSTTVDSDGMIMTFVRSMAPAIGVVFVA